MIFGNARPGTLPALTRDLGSRDPRTRMNAVEAAAVLVERGGDRDAVIAALSKSLSDELAEVRGAACLALADLGATELLPRLLAAADDSAPLVRQHAVTALGELGDERAHERLRGALTDSHAEVRFQAIVAFPRVCADAVQAWEALRVGLSDDDPHVRGRAAEACGEFADGQPLPAALAHRLTILLDASELAETRVAAAIALAESGDARGGDVLLDVMRGRVEEPDPGKVQAAFELAGELGLEEAADIALAAAFGLRARLGDASRRTAALLTLLKLRNARAIEHLSAELRSRSYERRVLALGLAARCHIQDVVPQIEALRAVAELQEAAEDALQQISSAAISPAPRPSQTTIEPRSKKPA